MPHRIALTLFLIIIAVPTIRADDVTQPTAAEFRKQNILERLARRIEPDLAGQPERLQQYIDFFQTEVGNDKRLFAFEVRPELASDGKVRLHGYIEFPESRAALNEFLTRLGFTVEDRLETLPSPSLGETRLAIVKVTHTLSYDAPGGRRRAETDCLLGEPLHLLRQENQHYLAHSGDGYLGYIAADDVVLVDEKTLARYLQQPTVHLRTDYQVPQGIALPAGARLRLHREHENVVHAELPSGETVVIPADKCTVSKGPATDMDAVFARAKKLLGTKYHWGGRTTNGIDCSGLVQVSYAAAGLHLPRDSYQQMYVGRLAATRWHRGLLSPGDTLYFLGEDGKIRHTGLYLGDDRFIQAVTPVVRINSFNPKHDDYDERHDKSLAFAKRLVE
jgi:hypothetical protein